MSKEDTHKLSDEEVSVELKRQRRQLFDLRAQAVTQKVEDPTQLRKTRRQVARLLTEQRARQIAADRKVMA